MKVNIRKIAELADCSPAAVSRTLSGKPGRIRIGEKTKARILEACRQLDYTPSVHAARLFSRRSMMIGFLVAQESLWEDENLSRSLFGTCSFLLKHKYRMLPLSLNRDFIDGKEYLNIFSRREIDGMIIWGAREEHSFLKELEAAGFPFMLLTNPVGDYPSVSSAQKEAVKELVRHCASRGAKRFVGVMSHEGESFRQREAGFIEASAPFDSELVIADQNIKSGYELAAELLKRKADAIICGNDEIAIGIEKYMFEHGVRIPEELLLTGGDNIKMSGHCQIPISSFDQQAVLCAEHCAEILLKHLEEGEELRTMQIPAPLILRRSTGD